MGVRVMGVYKGKKRVGYEIFFGAEARKFPPAVDLITLHKNILLVRDRKDGFIAFLNVNFSTLVREKEELKSLFQHEAEEMPFIPVLEVRIEEVAKHMESKPDETKSILEEARYEFPAPLSFSGARLKVKDYELMKDFSPDYIKMPIKEISCLKKEAIETIIRMIGEDTGSSVVFTHVESEEEFKKVPEETLWLGFYEERILHGD